MDHHENYHPGFLSVTAVVGIIAGSFLGWWLVFLMSWRVSDQYFPPFRLFEPHQRADWCSRVNSSVHALVVSTGLTVAYFQQEWVEQYFPSRDTSLAMTFFAISIGYFLCDLVIILYWFIPLWPVFVLHHMFALIPYSIFCFDPASTMGFFYGLNLFLLVEWATLPLNAKAFLEQTGHGHSKLHTVSFYITYVVWLVSRVMLPIYLIYYMWWFALKWLKVSPFLTAVCLLCGHAIAFFCIGVFVFMWTADLIARWKQDVDTVEPGAAVTTPLLRDQKSADALEQGSITPTTQRRKSRSLVDVIGEDVEELVEVVKEGMDINRDDAHYFKEDGVTSFVR